MLGFSSTQSTMALTGGAEIQPHNIRGLAGKVCLGTDTPRPVTLQIKAFFAEHFPDGVNGHLQRLG